MKPKFLRPFALGTLPLLVSCLAGRPVIPSDAPAPEGKALGSFSIASQTLGDQTFAPVTCTAGDHQLFLGADLEAPGSPVVLRLVVDPLGDPAVRLFSPEAPFDKSVVFQRRDCSVFHFSLESTGWRINDFNDYRLTLQLECAKAGERLGGSASSTHCH